MGEGAALGSGHPRTATEKLNADISVQTYLAPLNSWHEKEFSKLVFILPGFSFLNKLLLLTCIPQNTTVT